MTLKELWDSAPNTQGPGGFLTTGTFENLDNKQILVLDVDSTVAYRPVPGTAVCGADVPGKPHFKTITHGQESLVEFVFREVPAPHESKR